MQATSGGYLALFLIIHIVAVQYGRLALNLDTNFHFAAAGLHVSPFGYFFGPYYFLAILSLFIHVGCALSRFISHSTRIRGLTVAAFACAGAVAATVILASLMGLIHEYTVPQEYINTFMQE